MSFVVKAEKALDSNKPPNYWTVNETEVILQNRSARSQNTENYYHISPDKTVRSGDDTLPLEVTAPHSVSSSDSEDNILKKLEWAKSDDSVFTVCQDKTGQGKRRRQLSLLILVV